MAGPPITGVSMRYTLTQARDLSRKPVQYYEMMGHRAIYSDGWKAVTRHTPGVAYADDDWSSTTSPSTDRSA